jgi:transposase
MINHTPSTRQAPSAPAPAPSHAPLPPQPLRIGVGIDTARYGHYAAFLRPDLLPVADELPFTESAQGYDALRARLDLIVHNLGPVHFHVRLDAAGQYADNLLHFLHQGATRDTHATPLPMTISCGDPQRNKNYRAALFGPQKSDPVEARAAARYALNERPKPRTPPSLELRQLRQIAGRLQAVTRQRTRLANQLHQLLVHAFPGLATLTQDLTTGWVLELLTRYPTAVLLAAASERALDDIPYLPKNQIQPLLLRAKSSIASLTGDLEEELVRDQVRQVRDVQARQKRLENLLVLAYRRLPVPNHLDTIKGLGDVTAAILTAGIGDINRFETPGKLVAYFGTLPIEASSGVERDGTPRGPKRCVMSKRGNDLVRRYLWMAALCAVRHNPAVRPPYLRVIAKHPEHKAIAIGHAMRKLLHLAFAIWKSGKPFDPEHYRWKTPAHVAGSDNGVSTDQEMVQPSDRGMSVEDQTAGHKPASEPARKVVTAASGVTVAGNEAVGEDSYVDFAHLKKQLPLVRVLDHLGLTERLRGSGAQRRCACPIHRGEGRGRTFSVNLEENVFACHQASCGKKGDVIDLWAALHGLSLRAAALELVRTFGLEPAPQARTEKRNG